MSYQPVSPTDMNKEKVGIVGSGLIGRSFAMLFAAAGYNVVIYDINPHQVTDALDNILKRLHQLKETGLLRGSLSVEEQHSLISGTDSLVDCVIDTVYVQECVPERLKLKKLVFEELDKLVTSQTVLASSTSAMPASIFCEHLKHRSQVIVAHPTNPPFYCPLVEVVPTPFTCPSVTQRTQDILKELGQVPVLVKKEVFGFALNRMQYTLMEECWRLVQDDVISANDIDTVMTEGLGMRYAFLGPLETCHLNAEGMKNYCDRYGENIFKVAESFGPVPKWEGPVADQIRLELCRRLPLERLEEGRKWRDARLTALAKLKKNQQET